MAQQERVKAFEEGCDWHKKLVTSGMFWGAIAAASIGDLIISQVLFWIFIPSFAPYLELRWVVWFIAVAGAVILAMRQHVSRWWALITAGIWWFWAFWLVRRTMVNGYSVYYQARYLNGASPNVFLSFVPFR